MLDSLADLLAGKRNQYWLGHLAEVVRGAQQDGRFREISDRDLANGRDPLCGRRRLILNRRHAAARRAVASGNHDAVVRGKRYQRT